MTPADEHSVSIKICGVTDPAAMEVACTLGVGRVGLVFVAASPRYVELEQAKDLAEIARGRARVVALTLDADDAELDRIISAIAPDELQLHGRESPERVGAVKARTGLPVIKAVGLAVADDLVRARDFFGVADHLLFDAKPPPGDKAALPGGNGIPFDWRLLLDIQPDEPYILSGGLTPENVCEALRLTGARGVDVSSGVEAAPGRKDPQKIKDFVAEVRGASAASQGD